MPAWKKVITSGSNAELNSLLVTDFIELTGSLNILGSTTQIGTNSLIGNTTLSGSIIISGSESPSTPSVQIYGDTQHDGLIRLNPISRTIDTSISASYIYVSGSTDDLYFSQNGKGYNNVTRLRWLEGNLYTGLLNGGVISATLGSQTYQISSGSGIIVSMNASLSDNPYPEIQYLNWGNLTGNISSLTSSYQQAFLAIDNTGNILQQGTPFDETTHDNDIQIGLVLFQNGSTINGFKTQPHLAYGGQQQTDLFVHAFGPLKLSGYALAPSGSSTRSLVVGSGTAFSIGSNYEIDPNNPSYAQGSGTNVSKIFRYRQSGSAWVYDTNGGAGYTTIDPTQYANVTAGTLDSVSNNKWTIQRVFWFPNSVAKAIVVYYGNTVYDTQADANANIPYESFAEAPNTATNAIYLGSIVIKGDGVFTTDTDYSIRPGGLFRQVGGSGGGSISSLALSGLSDVTITSPTNKQPIAYNTSTAKWENISELSANITGSLLGNASTSTTASYALTASVAPNYVLNSVTSSMLSPYLLASQTSSLITTASVSLNTITFTKGDASTFNITVDTGSGGGGAAFPYTGSAEITGSLGITGSLNIYKSGSTVFDIQGSQGQLFSVTDSLSGSLFSVNDISGIPILEVFSDDTVKIGTFNNEAIIVSGSSAIITGSFTGSFTGDGSGLTGINIPSTSSLITTASVSLNTITFTKGDASTFNITVDTGSGGGGDAFPYTGSAEITGSLGITGSLTVGNITPSGTDGRIDASNDIVAYSSSDKRWKTNIKKIESPLEKLQKLSGVEFDWIKDVEVHGNTGNDVGVIAQEVELVLPQAVQTRDSGMKAVRYEKLIPLLIETIKEQQKQINELKNKIG